MNISLKNNEDAVSGVLKVEVVKTDYEDQVEKSLRSFRQKANIPGFRKGMVPMGMIRKMYGKNILADEVTKIATENLYKYIRENDLSILGEPLPNQTEQEEINFETEENFNFYFDVALAPEVSVELNKRDKLAYYQVIIDDDMLNKQIESYQANFGIYDDTVEVVEENDLIKGTVTELENGSPKEGGITVDEAVFMPLYVKDEAEKNKFIGIRKGDSVVFNPNKAYEGAEAEIASFLKIKKEEVSGITNDFSFEVKEITHHKKAELNQELFDKVFGENTVTNEEEFKNKVKESINEQFTPHSDFKFLSDARELLMKKAGDITFADSLLKRWLLLMEEERTVESVDESYPKIVEDLKYQLIKESIIKKNELKVEREDIDLFARKVAQAQFSQYGMLSLPDHILDDYVKNMLKNQQTLQNIIDRALDDKLAAWLKEKVKIEIKEVSIDDFNKLFEGEK